ncbi:uncharacterized protein EI90DRAFT_3010940 [Cantharellus anzutake]|uniref:uncharacterized protein n=1 Tax=Cantharellus anzutake TaxID=1750568 RepID=UPI0019040509|nr:uncharacterized protein EI90DRAFT_3010940 [Cantharellus anzutake]KAF8344142.1 hypothetical protein EI90DRAFT_3010940 [Cantharellus anzutake]
MVVMVLNASMLLCGTTQILGGLLFRAVEAKVHKSGRTDWDNLASKKTLIPLKSFLLPSVFAAPTTFFELGAMELLNFDGKAHLKEFLTQQGPDGVERDVDCASRGGGAGQSIIVMVPNLCPNDGIGEWCPEAGLILTSRLTMVSAGITPLVHYVQMAWSLIGLSHHYKERVYVGRAASVRAASLSSEKSSTAVVDRGGP